MERKIGNLTLQIRGVEVPDAVSGDVRSSRKRHISGSDELTAAEAQALAAAILGDAHTMAQLDG